MPTPSRLDPLPLQILIQPQRAGLSAGASQQLEVLIRLQAADLPQAAETEPTRAPHALALVIDRSSSMAGKPLGEACRCAQFVVSRLASTDVLALVQFDNRVERLWPAVPVRDGQSVRAAIGRIQSGGSTNLHGGWLDGADSLTEVPGEGLKRVILLSDGCANQGTTDTDDIASQCAQWAARGISTSTYGLGNGFNEDLMVAMARAGGGNHYYGDTADDLMEPFERELDLIAHLVLRRPVLRVRAADGVKVVMMNLLQRSPDGGWFLSDLAAGAEAWALLSVHVSAERVAEVGSLAHLLEIEVSGNLPDGAPVTLPTVALELPVLDAAVWRPLPEDELVQRRRAELQAAEALTEIQELVAAKDWERVDLMLGAARRRFGNNPWLADVMRAMTDLASRRDHERFDKEIAYFRMASSSRLAAAHESLELTDALEVPSFLRRKARQGKA